MLRIKTCNRFLPLIHRKIELIPFFRQQWAFPSLAQTFGTFWKCFDPYNGQSAIERGFSISKQLLVENLNSKSLVALRRIEDHMRYSEQSPETIKVSNKIIESVKEAHSRYQSELAKQKAEKEDTQKSFKQRIATAEIKAVKQKWLKLTNEISVLHVDADLWQQKLRNSGTFNFWNKPTKRGGKGKQRVGRHWS